MKVNFNIVNKQTESIFTNGSVENTSSIRLLVDASSLSMTVIYSNYCYYELMIPV